MGLGGGSNDVFLLTGPNGSQMNVASFVVEPGPDFGEADLLKTIYSENPAMEGGVLAAEYVNVRRMAFPLRIASLSAFGGAAGVAAWLRTLARPGATLDIQLDGVATAEAVRFDVNAGRYEVGAWNTQMWSQTDRMEGTLKLDVQPFGYWPTWITLASAASVGLPGFLTVPTNIGAGSIFGDVPAWGRLLIMPTSPTTFAFANSASWYVDNLGWSLHGQGASFRALWNAASINALSGGTLTADAFALGSQAVETLGKTIWSLAAGVLLPASLATSYGGRFRLWTLAKLSPSQALPWYVSGDVSDGAAVADLASSAPIATLYPALASGGGSGGAWAAASPGYNLLDLGEICLPVPQSASGQAVPNYIRLWTQSPTTTLPVATPLIRFSNIWLQPLPNAGVLTRNLKWHLTTPISHWDSSPGALSLDSSVGRVLNVQADASTPVREAAGDHRGVLPYVGASITGLEIAGFTRSQNAPTTTIARQSPAYAAASLQQRPRFLFIKGI